MHQPVFFKRVHLAGFDLGRFKKAQRFRDRDLIDEDLIGAQILLGDAVAGLDDTGLCGGLGDSHACSLLEKPPDRHGVGRVVGTLVNHLERIIRGQHCRRNLHTARTPAVGHWHLAAGERHLITRNGKPLKDRATDHAFGLLVKIGKVVVAHSAASRLMVSCASRRSLRISSSSDWKST